MLLVESGDLNLYKKLLNKKRSLIPLVPSYIFVQGFYSFLCLNSVFISASRAGMAS